MEKTLGPMEKNLSRIRAGAAVLNQTPMDWRGNVSRACKAIGMARKAGVSLLCLPELCLSGYGCEDMFLSGSVERYAWQALEEVAPHSANMVVAVGLPVSYRSRVFNCAALLVDGQVVGLVAKQFLARAGIHYEPRWFAAWPKGEAHHTQKGVPIGDLVFDVGSVRIGFEICEDAWAAQRPGQSLSQHGLDVLLSPSASHFSLGKNDIRKRIVLEGSRAFGSGYIYSNLLGNEAGRAIYDGGAMLACAGAMVATGPRFSFEDVCLTDAVLELGEARMLRAQRACSSPEEAPALSMCVRTTFEWPSMPPEIRNVEVPAWEKGTCVKEEEFTRATCLGLFDYLRKSRSGGFVVSLSGGADSAACAVLVRLCIEMAAAELGMDGIAHKLAHIPNVRQAGSVAELVNALLITLYQSTEHSSETTRNAASQVAESISASHSELDVSELVRGYVTRIEQALHTELSWAEHDIALQNIQARVRGPSAWLIANVRGFLLLSTSNRSESAVGYATMDGDTCGGLSPIAGIDKAFLQHWLRWMQSQGMDGYSKFPELKYVNDQVPTAELRPHDSAQTDESDLMPYPVLDAIERHAIGMRRSPAEVIEYVRNEFPAYEQDLLLLWIKKFFSLWAKNQWKRERFAPSFHLDDRDLDPKAWCRFPILSGGFEVELEHLQSHKSPAQTED
ncbi:MAG: NAD(+) synthase [Myxococcota bacterium]